MQNIFKYNKNKSVLLGLLALLLSILLTYLCYGKVPVWIIPASVVFLYIVYIYYLVLNRLNENKIRQRIYRNEIIAQTQALINIYQKVKIDGYVPPMIPWSASPDFISILIQQILVRKPKNIVELGSGVSTIILASMIKERDLDIQLLSIDHDEYYANKTKEHLEFHGLSEYVDLQVRPFKVYEIASDEYNWYKWDGEGSSEIDMLIVDGPPGGTNKQSRYPALPILKNNLSENASILVDDADRPDEFKMISRWVREFACHKAMEWKTDKGTVELIYEPVEEYGT